MSLRDNRKSPYKLNRIHYVYWNRVGNTSQRWLCLDISVSKREFFVLLKCLWCISIVQAPNTVHEFEIVLVHFANLKTKKKTKKELIKWKSSQSKNKIKRIKCQLAYICFCLWDRPVWQTARTFFHLVPFVDCGSPHVLRELEKRRTESSTSSQ